MLERQQYIFIFYNLSPNTNLNSIKLLVNVTGVSTLMQPVWQQIPFVPQDFSEYFSRC